MKGQITLNDKGEVLQSKGSLIYVRYVSSKEHDSEKVI